MNKKDLAVLALAGMAATFSIGENYSMDASPHEEQEQFICRGWGWEPTCQGGHRPIDGSRRT